MGILFCETPCVRLAHTNGRPYETNMFQSCLGCNTMLPRNCYYDYPTLASFSKVDTLWCLWSSSMFVYFSKPLHSPKETNNVLWFHLLFFLNSNFHFNNLKLFGYSLCEDLRLVLSNFKPFGFDFSTTSKFKNTQTHSKIKSNFMYTLHIPQCMGAKFWKFSSENL